MCMPEVRFFCVVRLPFVFTKTFFKIKNILIDYFWEFHTIVFIIVIHSQLPPDLPLFLTHPSLCLLCFSFLSSSVCAANILLGVVPSLEMWSAFQECFPKGEWLSPWEETLRIAFSISSRGRSSCQPPGDSLVSLAAHRVLQTEQDSCISPPEAS